MDIGGRCVNNGGGRAAFRRQEGSSKSNTLRIFGPAMPARVRCNGLSCGSAGGHRTRRRDEHGEADCRGKHGQTGMIVRGAALKSLAPKEISNVRCKPRRRLNGKTSQQAAMVAATSTPSPCSIAATPIDTQSPALAASQSPALAAMGEMCIAKSKALIDLAHTQGLLEIGEQVFLLASVTALASSLDYLFLECAFGDSHEMCTDSIALAFLQIAIALSPVASTSTNSVSANAATSAEVMTRNMEPRAHVRASAAKLVPRILDRIGSGLAFRRTLLET